MTDFDDIRMNKNSLVITIAFQPRGVTIAMPPSAANLAQLGAVDTGQAPIAGSTTTTVAGATTVPAGSTVAGATPTTVAGGDARRRSRRDDGAGGHDDGRGRPPADRRPTHRR